MKRSVMGRGVLAVAVMAACNANFVAVFQADLL